MEKNLPTFSYRQARDHGIDTRDFETVMELPTGVQLTVICGVWGDRRNLRVLFELKSREVIIRHAFSNHEYTIKEIGRPSRVLEIDVEYIVEAPKK